MTSMNLKPGIHNVQIYSSYEDKENPIITLSRLKENKINFEFTLTGLNKLLNPITQKLDPFHLYILLSFQFGGRDFEIISSGEIYCEKKIMEKGNVAFLMVLDIPMDKVYLQDDFIWDYYSIDLVFTKTTVEDGSDINRLLMGEKLYSNKINVTFEDDKDG